MVCRPCHKALGGGLDVNATGEFRVPTEAEIDAHVAESTAEAGTQRPPQTTNVCSWCGKLEKQVRKLLGRGGVALCDECVSLASDIMEAEIGPNWR